MSHRISLRFLALFALGTTACGEEFTHLRFDDLTQPPLPASTSRRHIRLYEGTAVAVKAVAMDDEDVMEEPPHLRLEACDHLTAGVAPAFEDRHDWYEGYGDDERPPEETAPAFVMWGASAGRSCFRVIVDGEERSTVSVTVLPPN